MFKLNLDLLSLHFILIEQLSYLATLSVIPVLILLNYIYIFEMEEQNNKEKRNKHVRWDEEKLKQTQKDRGRYQKITEPKTPYAQRQEDEEQIVTQMKSQQQIQVENSLKKAKENRQKNNHGKIDLKQLNQKLKAQMSKYKYSDDEMDQEQSQAKRKKKQEFAKKRANHYKEFQQIQQMKNNKWENDDEDD